MQRARVAASAATVVDLAKEIKTNCKQFLIRMKKKKKKGGEK